MIDCRPLTADRWDDLERLFGPERGAASGCWCMAFKLRRAEWEEAGRAGRKVMFRTLVEQGPPPGVLAYTGDQAVGWCAVEPRESYPAMLRSRARQPVDDRPAFAITCFYLTARWRRKGLMRPLIRGALDLARSRGAALVEAYPLDPAPGEHPSGAFTGIAKAFRDEGFVDVARRSKVRVILRREL